MMGERQSQLERDEATATTAYGIMKGVQAVFAYIMLNLIHVLHKAWIF